MLRSMNRTLTEGFSLREADKLRLQASLSLTTDYDLTQYLQPKESDYVMIPVRALSATGVQNNMFNFGWGGGGPLKNSVDKFNGMIVLKDHNMSVDTWLGTTQDAYWDNSEDIPPGVNCMLKVDTKADPKTARGLISGALNSVSVTVSFDYEPSHPEMDEWDFFMAMGTEVDGKIVQANITNIKRLFEISVVWQGADVYAKQKQKPLSNSLNLNLLPEPKKENAVDWKKLALLMGLSQAEPTEEDITNGITALVASKTTTKTELDTVKVTLVAEQAKVVDLTTKVTASDGLVAAAKAEVVTATTQLDSFKKDAELGKKFVAKQRTEAVRLYKLVEADKMQPAMVTMLETANLEIAESFISTYTARAEQIAPLVCSECQKAGKAGFSRRASKQGEQEIPVAVVSAEDARLTASVNSIHGK